MTVTLEPIGVFQTAFVVIDVNDYLDVRRPGWIVLEKAGGVMARDKKVYVKPELSDVLDSVSRAFPAKYTVHAKQEQGDDDASREF